MQTHTLIFLGILCALAGIFPALGFTHPIVSVLFIIGIALPSYYATYKVNGYDGILLIVLLSILGLVVETIGLLTGFPYGSFAYADMTGYTLFGSTPVVVLFVFAPLVLGAIWLTPKKIWMLGTVGILVLTDALLDPVLVALGVWTWQNTGWYYGIPFTNFLGWILISLIAVALVRLYRPRLTRATVLSLYITLSFWTGTAITLQLWIPALIGALFTVLIIIKYQHSTPNHTPVLAETTKKRLQKANTL